MKLFKAWPLVLLASALTLTIAGCSKKSTEELGQVEGVIRVNGTPTPGLTVFFESPSGTSTSGITNDAGRYSISSVGGHRGAQVGKNIVRITGRDRTMGDASLSEIAASQGTTVDALKAIPIIPAKYNEKSDLTAEVTNGKGVFDFDLEI